MSGKIKAMVSKQKIRYQSDGFDLDLSYISKNLIAMGFPAEGVEGVYRNHITDVRKFLESKHGGHYKLYNLCSERSYDCAKFNAEVSSNFSFDDHHPPQFDRIEEFCRDVHTWLSGDDRNVAVVHCKAGKGRTGVMICAYLLYSKLYIDSIDALTHYAKRRTMNFQGVTLPSQVRYVQYYGYLLQHQLQYKTTPLLLRSITIENIPKQPGHGDIFNPSFLIITIRQQKTITFKSEVQKLIVRRFEQSLVIQFPGDGQPVYTDVRMDFYSNRHKMMKVLNLSRIGAVRILDWIDDYGGLVLDVLYSQPDCGWPMRSLNQTDKDKLFWFWFNTFFVKEASLSIDSEQNGVNSSVPCGGIRQRSATTVDSSTHSKRAQQSGRYHLVLSKNEIDKAHKDRQQRVFMNDFKVHMRFSDPLVAHQREHAVLSHMASVPADSSSHVKSVKSGINLSSLTAVLKPESEFGGKVQLRRRSSAAQIDAARRTSLDLMYADAERRVFRNDSIASRSSGVLNETDRTPSSEHLLDHDLLVQSVDGAFRASRGSGGGTGRKGPGANPSSGLPASSSSRLGHVSVDMEEQEPDFWSDVDDQEPHAYPSIASLPVIHTDTSDDSVNEESPPLHHCSSVTAAPSLLYSGRETML